MKKIKLLTSIAALGIISSALPFISSCGDKPQTQYEISEEYITTKKIQGSTEEVGALSGRAYIAAFSINDEKAIDNIKVEVVNLQGLDGIITASISKIYENYFGVILNFQSNSDYLVVQKPTFDLKFSIDGKEIKTTTGWQTTFTTYIIQAVSYISSKQKFVSASKKSNYSFILDGAFACISTLTSETIEDVENFYLELEEGLPISAKLEFSIINLKEEKGRCYIKCNLSNFDQDIKNLPVALTIRNKLFPGWSESIKFNLNFLITQEVSDTFDFKKEDSEVYVESCYSVDEDVTIPSKATIKSTEYDVTAISPTAFKNMINLKHVTFPDKLKLITQNSFENCINLDNLSFPETLQELRYCPFKNCINIKNVEVAENNPYYTTTAPDGKTYPAIFTKEQKVLYVAFNLTQIPEGVEDIANFAFEHSQLESITIPTSVKVIGSSAFSQCTKLKSVNFAEGSNLKQIYSMAFGGCESLQDINLPNTTTEIKFYAFRGCSALKKIELPDNLDSLDDDLFQGCESLEEVIISGSTSLLSKGEEDFNGCYSLKKLTVKNEPTKVRSKDLNGNECNCLMNSTCTTLYYAGYESTLPDSITTITESAYRDRLYLENVTLPSNLVYIGKNAFYNCRYLESVNLADTITMIGEGAFRNCMSLTNVKLPALLTTLEKDLFCDCYLIENITFGTKITDIKEDALRGCVSLKTADISKCDELINIDEGAFMNCFELETHQLPKNLQTIGQSSFFNNFKLTQIEIPNTVTTIKSYAFDRTSLESITLPASITTLGNGVFLECYALTSADLSACVNLKTINNFEFQKCYNLNSVKLPTALERIDMSAFQECTSLKTIDLPSTLIFIGIEAFCKSGIESITIPSGVTELIMYSFSECESLKAIKFEGKLTGIAAGTFSKCPILEKVEFDPSALTTLGAYSFAHCPAITSLDLSSSKITTLDDETFRGCSALTEVKLPDAITSIGERTFYECESLTTITLPASLQTISYAAFAYCEKLNNITIPSQVKLIAPWAFTGCDALTSATFANTSNWYDLQDNPVDVSDATKGANVLKEGKSIYVKNSI